MSESYYNHDKASVRELITPEGIDLKIKLADAGSRFGAFCIDIGIMIATLFAALWILSLTYAASFPYSDGGDLIVVVWILIFFVLRNFYFMFFEMGPKAATPGKRALKIRVASRNKARLTANAVFTRNALREIEFFMPMTFLFQGSSGVDGLIALLGLVWSGIFLLFPLFNKDRLRAGDLLAGTWVIRAPKPILAKDLADDEKGMNENFIFTPQQVEAYGVHELHVLEDVLRARDLETMIDVAKRIRKKIDWNASLSETDEAFLKAYYTALRGRLETRLLFGVRKKDKFDKS